MNVLWFQVNIPLRRKEEGWSLPARLSMKIKFSPKVPLELRRRIKTVMTRFLYSGFLSSPPWCLLGVFGGSRAIINCSFRATCGKLLKRTKRGKKNGTDDQIDDGVVEGFVFLVPRVFNQVKQVIYEGFFKNLCPNASAQVGRKELEDRLTKIGIRNLFCSTHFVQQTDG